MKEKYDNVKVYSVIIVNTGKCFLSLLQLFYMYFCLHVWVSVCLSFCLSVFLSVCLSAYLWCKTRKALTVITKLSMAVTQHALTLRSKGRSKVKVFTGLSDVLQAWYASM